MNKIIPLKAFEDNYIWLIHSEKSSQIIAVDPGEANPVLAYLQANNLTLAGILLTHKHWDHTGGVKTLLQHFPTIPVYGSETDQVEGITKFITEDETITFECLNSPIHILDIPGHTLGHVAYVYENTLFCGDTLFSVGMGKIFEGTPAQMYDSLQKIKKLPQETLIYCGHEYTLSNIKFAETIEPQNHALKHRKHEVENLIKNNLPTLPISLSIEYQTNPFLRIEQPEVIQALKTQGYKGNTPVETLLFLRELKNKF